MHRHKVVISKHWSQLKILLPRNEYIQETLYIIGILTVHFSSVVSVLASLRRALADRSSTCTLDP